MYSLQDDWNCIRTQIEVSFIRTIISVSQLNIGQKNQKQLVLILCGVLLLFSSFFIRVFSLWTCFTLSLLLVSLTFLILTFDLLVCVSSVIAFRFNQ